jgi:hypothetical protein
MTRPVLRQTFTLLIIHLLQSRQHSRVDNRYQFYVAATAATGRFVQTRCAASTCELKYFICSHFCFDISFTIYSVPTADHNPSYMHYWLMAIMYLVNLYRRDHSSLLRIAFENLFYSIFIFFSSHVSPSLV